MSERNSFRIWLILLVVLFMAVVATVMNFADWAEIRDLQRRVGQLESQQR